jgi:hypothetical protein
MASTETLERLERELLTDLRAAARERFIDEDFMIELYRALTNTTWRKPGGPEGHIAFSWKRAEEIVNALRAEVDRPPLRLAQSVGGEGRVSRAVEDVLGSRGWVHEALDTSRHDDFHEDSPEDPPPAARAPGRRRE